MLVYQTVLIITYPGFTLLVSDKTSNLIESPIHISHKTITYNFSATYYKSHPPFLYLYNFFFAALKKCRNVRNLEMCSTYEDSPPAHIFGSFCWLYPWYVRRFSPFFHPTWHHHRHRSGPFLQRSPLGFVPTIAGESRPYPKILGSLMDV